MRNTHLTCNGRVCSQKRIGCTRDAITTFEEFEQKIVKEKKTSQDSQDEQRIKDEIRKRPSGLRLGTSNSAGNGPLMRLAPIPCFFFESYDNVQKYIDETTLLTHGDQKAVGACRFYTGLIWYALNGKSENELLGQDFYHNTLHLELHSEVKEIAEGSYIGEKNRYDDGIRGKGYVVNALETALWAFYNDKDKFIVGVLLAVNSGDDTDTTAAVYGELAGGLYGIEKIRPDCIERLYQKDFIKTVANCLYMRGVCRPSGDEK